MKIKNVNNTVLIRNLDCGNVFESCSIYYLVTDETDGCITYCVNLETGVYVPFKNLDTVRKCNAELHIL